MCKNDSSWWMCFFKKYFFGREKICQLYGICCRAHFRYLHVIFHDKIILPEILETNAINLEEIFLIVFLTFISLFSLIVYFDRFNTNNKRHFLTYILIRVSMCNSTFPYFNLSMYTEEDGTIINNEGRKEF